MLNNKILTGKNLKKIMISYGIILIISSLFTNTVYIGLLGLVLIISASLIFGIKGAIISSISATVAVLIASYMTNGEIVNANILISIIFYYFIGLIIGKSIDVIKEQKKKLGETNSEIKEVFNGTQDSLFLIEVVYGNTFRYLRNNKKHQHSTGISLEQIKGKTPVQLVGDELGKKIEDNYRQCLKLKKSINYEEKMILPSGEKTWKTSLNPVIKNGEVKYIVGSSKDISDRKKAEEDLIQFNNLIEYIIKHNSSGIAVHDKNMNYMYVSERYLERYGLKGKNIIGKNHYEVFPDLPQKWREAHKRSLKGEVISKKEDPYYRKDGSVDWTKWETRPWYEKDGSIGGIIIYTEIITEQIEMEEEIYREREQFKTTLLSVGDAIISTDKKGNIKLMNNVAEKLTGWTQEEAQNKSLEKVLTLIHEISRKPCDNPAKKALKWGKTVEMENHTILISKDGREIPIEDSSAPIKDRDGNITGVVIVFRDFTEKREKQKQIEYLSFHDHLTGLYNRRYMEDSIKRLDTNRNIPFSIIVTDVNGLKLTNDAYGHDMGDKLLIKVSDILKSSCRKEDIICRVGGDEFVVLLPGIDKEKAEEITDRIVEESHNASLDSVIISLAVGYATKNRDDKDILEVYKEADNKMYKNKLRYGKIMRNKTIETVLLNINNKYDNEQIHTERVSQYCEGIARAMNLNNNEIEDAKVAGALHDIGKIIVPTEILNKKSRLTEEDWETIKKHAVTSYQLLKSVNEYAHLAEAVLYHHERLDGSGYPEGLREDEIPLLSKIIAVADAYEAMTANRPYQQKKTKEEAVKELKKYSGTHFDEDIVEVFVNKVL
jgi:diguanylate cyclase (GGDEF)-like protein/PAS domain S-box-containing protein